jgi:hypothetical protein
MLHGMNERWVHVALCESEGRAIGSRVGRSRDSERRLLSDLNNER